MNVLLTGATGFIGFNLAIELLAEDNNLTVVSRHSKTSSNRISKLTELGASVADCREVEYLQDLMNSKTKFDHVIHLAAHYSRIHEPSEIRPMFEAAVILGTEMLEIGKTHNARFYHAGSYLEYMENVTTRSSLYVSSKKSFEEVASYYEKNESLEITKLVFFDTYGKGDTRDKILNKIMSLNLLGKELTLENPEQLIDLTHISDVTQGLLKTMQNPFNKLARINSGSFITIGNLLRLVAGDTSFPHFTNESPRNLLARFPALALRTPANWEPKIPLTSGIKSMLESQE